MEREYADCRECFVRKLRSVRHERGKTQEQFAEAIGVSDSTYKKVERNILPPSFEFLCSLRRYLGSSIDNFLSDEKNELENIWMQLDNATETDQLLVVLRLSRKYGPEKMKEIIGIDEERKRE